MQGLGVHLVNTRVSRLFRATTAVALIASLVTWRPAMLACMTAPHGTEQPAHHHGAPQHHTVPLDCCRACARACTVAPGLSAAPAAVAFHGSIEYAPSTADQAPLLVLAAPHRLPFSVGPPPPLA
jgi:hypothetical protein